MSDRRNFEKLYISSYDAVLRYCLRRTSHEDALDAAAETFVVAWRRRSDIPEDRYLPWLYGVARKVLANQRRSIGRYDNAVAELRVVGNPGPEQPETQVVRNQDAQEMVEALGHLRPADREIIALAGWEELGRDEIAVALGCTPNAITKRLNRALDRLADELGVGNRSHVRFFRRGEVSG
ncbi:MAG: sigma-70 family RNA polymerase sigma factor [Actinomycetota bacterium]